MKKQRKIISKFFNISVIILLIICTIMYFISVYLKENFTEATFEQLYYTLTTAQGFSLSSIAGGFVFILKKVILIIIICLILNKMRLIIKKYDISVNLKILNKYFKISYPLKNIKIFKFLINICIIIFCIFILNLSINNVGYKEYKENKKEETTIYENYFVEPLSINIKFPDKKRNLIHIYLESMEYNFAYMKENGKSISYIPELVKLYNDKENINFSNSNDLGGGYVSHGGSWTIAALVSISAGLPLKVTSIDGNNYSNYNSFLPGATTIGDILEDNGYNNYFLLGSDVKFAGRKEFYTTHGNYTIYDYINAKEEKFIDNDYHVFWGHEDAKLFERAKEKLNIISKEEEPFNFTILTVDTHFQDGYMDSSCNKNKYSTTYANSIACSSKKVYDFVKWVQKQDFYENTTIVLVGDHLTMQYGDFLKLYDTNYRRGIFNLFINSAVKTNNNKNRNHCQYDYFPTILASIGAEIEGDRLGFGTNMFSSKPTLYEEIGEEYIQNELKKKSSYYNYYKLEDDYFEMIENNDNQ